jgi:hypothetical protein
MAGIPGFRTISVKEARELSKAPFVLDKELTDAGEARILSDGRVFLYLEGDRGVIYPSREALVKVIKEGEAEAAKGPFDPVKELLPPRDDFIRDIETHAKSLGKVLHIPEEALDRTEASLDAVDKHIRRLTKAKRMTPEIVTPLVAYVSLVMLRARSDLSWTTAHPTTGVQFTVHEDGKMTMGPYRYMEELSEPTIAVPDGGLLWPFRLVHLELHRGIRGSLRRRVDEALRPWTPEDRLTAAHRITGGELIPVTEVRRLSKLPWVRVEALSDRLSEARLLPDGRFLLYFGEGEKGTLYPSRAAVERILWEGAEQPSRFSVVSRRALLPPVADFLRDVSAHAASLSDRLRVPREALDRTVESLHAVDQGVLRLTHAKLMKPELVTPLVAYVGLVLLDASNGRWTTLYPRTRYLARDNPDGTTTRQWVTTREDDDEPTILASDGRLFQPLALVTTEIDRQQGGSMYRGVTGTLAYYPSDKTAGPTG